MMQVTYGKKSLLGSYFRRPEGMLEEYLDSPQNWGLFKLAHRFFISKTTCNKHKTHLNNKYKEYLIWEGMDEPLSSLAEVVGRVHLFHFSGPSESTSVHGYVSAQYRTACIKFSVAYSISIFYTIQSLFQFLYMLKKNILDMDIVNK